MTPASRALAAGLACLLGLALAAGADPAPVSSFQSPMLGPGGVFTTTPAAGTYAYHCHPHPFMQGRLTVLATPDPAGPKTHRIDIVDDGNATHTAAMGFRDAAGSNGTVLHAGDSIVWVNTGQLQHDVHLIALTQASNDLGTFEVAVLVGLVVALAGISYASRRI